MTDGHGSAEPGVAVRLHGLRKVFGAGPDAVTAVDGVDLEVTDGQFFSMLGPSGSGKTTVLRLVAGFELPTAGTIELGGVDVTRKAPFERDVNTVFQDYALFPHLDVLGNVAYGVGAPARVERERRAQEALAELDVSALAARRPSQLSGGEMQRVALARALACRPRALLMDEPLAALDVTVRRDTRRFLADRLRALAIPTVIVTHDLADAEALDGDIAVIEAGRIVQRGRLAELAAAPATEFVRRFVGT